MTEGPIAIGGPPGSGKSTAAIGVAARLGLRRISAGDRFRAEAERRGKTLAEFSRMAEEDAGIDRELDDRMLAEAVPGVILEGRVQGALLRRQGRLVVWLSLTADESVRAERLAHREGVPLGRALSEMRAREASERRRYREYYGIDVDQETPDFRVDSTELAPTEVVQRLLGYLGRRVPGA